MAQSNKAFLELVDETLKLVGAKSASAKPARTPPEEYQRPSCPACGTTYPRPVPLVCPRCGCPVDPGIAGQTIWPDPITPDTVIK